MDFILSSLRDQFSNNNNNKSQQPYLSISDPAPPPPSSHPSSNNNTDNHSFFHSQLAIVAPKPATNNINVKNEFSSSPLSDDDEDEDDTLHELDIESWHMPDVTSFDTPAASGAPQQYNTTPYLYRVLVVDFYNNVSSYSGILFEDLFDVDFFLAVSSPITSDNVLGTKGVFDRWFVRCCKNPFIVERAWSLVSTLNNRKFGVYANLILCKNIEVRYKFAELCACIYYDTCIETSTWRFSIHNQEDDNKDIMTKSKKEIQHHESRKYNLFHFFTQNNLLLKHVPTPMILANVAFGTTQSHYTDVSVDTYNSIIDACIHNKQTAQPNGLKVTFNHNNNNSEEDDWDPRYRLSVLERGASSQLLGDPSENWIFHTDEVGVLSSIGKILDPRIYPDINVIIKDSLMCILFATAVGYAYRKRHMRSSMIHVPISMQARIDKSKASIEIQLARLYSRFIRKQYQ